MSKYDPSAVELLSFEKSVPGFLDGSDTPRAYLERCIVTIGAREPEVQAFSALNLDGARAAADAATERYEAGQPLSPVDGMPVAIKDVFDTEDMPTTFNSDLFRENQTAWDGACPYFFRRGGAVIIGKTVTTEFAFGTPGPTRNPWDTKRTPGGSSSGSGAAVGASMVPLAVGTQVRGSVLRPAAFNGTYALKPSKGAFNLLGGFPSALSMACIGILSGTISDMWRTAWWLSQQGGEPGYPSLAGKPDLPKSRKPKCLIRLDTAGWAETDEVTRAEFDRVCSLLAVRGVEIVSRSDDPDIEALESMLLELRNVIDFMLTYEGRWPLMMYADRAAEKMGERVAGRAQDAAEADPGRYAECLDWANKARAKWDSFRNRADGFITLNQTGAAPAGMPVGNTAYGEASSLIGMPALNLPLMAVEGMPLGLQMLGFYQDDEALTALGHWAIHAVLRGED
jgi:Asp-tRNA(Asn)/Glu-tRNA(Gln) amidotransferase A subunit family amidase